MPVNSHPPASEELVPALSPSPPHRCWGAVRCLRAISVAKLGSAHMLQVLLAPSCWSDAQLALAQLSAYQGPGPSPQCWPQPHRQCCRDSAFLGQGYTSLLPQVHGGWALLDPFSCLSRSLLMAALPSCIIDLVLSANLMKLHPVTLSTSPVIQILNRTGPSTDPCGP